MARKVEAVQRLLVEVGFFVEKRAALHDGRAVFFVVRTQLFPNNKARNNNLS
jgi:hypothetical protein